MLSVVFTILFYWRKSGTGVSDSMLSGYESKKKINAIAAHTPKYSVKHVIWKSTECAHYITLCARYHESLFI